MTTIKTNANNTTEPTTDNNNITEPTTLPKIFKFDAKTELDLYEYVDINSLDAIINSKKFFEDNEQINWVDKNNNRVDMIKYYKNYSKMVSKYLGSNGLCRITYTYNKKDEYSRYITGIKFNRLITKSNLTLNNELNDNHNWRMNYTNINHQIRNRLLSDLSKNEIYCYDIDIKRCEPTIIFNLCKELNAPIECYDAIEEYINSDIKYDEVNKILNGFNYTEDNELLLRISENTNKLVEYFKTRDDIDFIKDAVKYSQKQNKQKGKNNQKTIITYIFFGIETKLLSSMYEYFKTLNHDDLSMMSAIHDGFILKSVKPLSLEQLTTIMNELEQKIHNDTEFKIKLVNKELKFDDYKDLEPRGDIEGDKSRELLIWEDICRYAEDNRYVRYKGGIYQRDEQIHYKWTRMYGMREENFINDWLLDRRQTNQRIYNEFKKNPTMYKKIWDYMPFDGDDNFKLYRQPTLENKIEHMRYYGYLNGVFDIVKNDFIPFEDVGEDVVCKNFFEEDFDFTMYDNLIEYLKLKHPKVLETLKYQEWDDNTITDFLGLFGRNFLPLHLPKYIGLNYKQKELMLYIYGIADGGKSCLIDTLSRIIGDENIFKICNDDKTHARFNQIHDKDLFLVDDDIKYFTHVIREEEFKTICNGTAMTTRGIAKDYVDGKDFKINQPFPACLNDPLDYRPSEHIAKRAVIIHYRKKIDPNIRDDSVKENEWVGKAPQLLPIFINEYHKLMRRVGTKNIWNVLSKQIQEWRFNTEEYDNLQTFLEEHFTYEENACISHQYFNYLYKQYKCPTAVYRTTNPNLTNPIEIEDAILSTDKYKTLFFNKQIRIIDKRCSRICKASLDKYKKDMELNRNSYCKVSVNPPHIYSKKCCSNNNADGNLKSNNQRTFIIGLKYIGDNSWNIPFEN